jgi:hypothetical protein
VQQPGGGGCGGRGRQHEGVLVRRGGGGDGRVRGQEPRREGQPWQRVQGEAAGRRRRRRQDGCCCRQEAVARAGRGKARQRDRRALGRAAPPGRRRHRRLGSAASGRGRGILRAEILVWQSLDTIQTHPNNLLDTLFAAGHTCLNLVVGMKQTDPKPQLLRAIPFGSCTRTSVSRY